MFTLVRFGDEQARVYAEGGIGFEKRLRMGGKDHWVVNDRPGAFIVRLAIAVRSEAFPQLSPIGVADVLAD